eukprot:CAMPEP_0183335786 /NCGR_PEP_ID=MMETSP0164_2-20130417/3973_1 /TAXON_ID=221442 /ORGANISM="Coccolithus pelagicus ssp braarudi, Strain PLY182g" /LENGTH=67 /DNA_ID=CAMNT_0025505199 /DNA_START=372 /DNA_END=572 /DNA_ORIENTATION=-
MSPSDTPQSTKANDGTTIRSSAKPISPLELASAAEAQSASEAAAMAKADMWMAEAHTKINRVRHACV